LTLITFGRVREPYHNLEGAKWYLRRGLKGLEKSFFKVSENEIMHKLTKLWYQMRVRVGEKYLKRIV
jgi:hypothetical protein